MTSIALSTALERAREAALVGDPASFTEHLRGIESLDRAGEAPTHELRMLALVAAARRADLHQVETLLEQAGTLPLSEWERVRRWLLAAPEMPIPAYAEFVRSLDRRIRKQTTIPAPRRWTPSLAIVLTGALLSLMVLAWRLSPRSPSQSNALAVRAVLAGDPGIVLEQLPSSWQEPCLQAGRLLAAHDSEAAWKSTEAAVDALIAGLHAASGSRSASRIAETLLGPRASRPDLDRVALGLMQWKAAPWLRVAAWGDPASLDWKPEGDALLAWRTALRHMPLGLWLPGWFSTQWQCEPLRGETVTVLRNSGDGARVTLQIVVGGHEWNAPATRVDRCWPPDALIDEWKAMQPRLDASQCTAA
ncbi:MAG: hypothetical protein RL277_1888, partial [Planctomycetota bacterium]